MALNSETSSMDEPPIKPFPTWPNFKTLDLQQIVVSYDRVTDTLMVHFYGRGQPAFSELMGDYTYLRIDPETNRVVGLQIEDFLYRAVKEHPSLFDALAIADLRGITPEEVKARRRRAMGLRGLISALIDRVVAATTHKPKRWAVVERLAVDLFPQEAARGLGPKSKAA